MLRIISIPRASPPRIQIFVENAILARSLAMASRGFVKRCNVGERRTFFLFLFVSRDFNRASLRAHSRRDLDSGPTLDNAIIIYSRRER